MHKQLLLAKTNFNSIKNNESESFNLNQANFIVSITQLIKIISIILQGKFYF